MAGTTVATLAIEVVADATKATAGLDKTAGAAGKMGKGIRTAAAPAALALAGIGAAAIDMAKAAADDAQSQAILEQAMKNTTGASADQVAAMEDFISATSSAAGVADDELRPALGNLLRATGDTAKSQAGLQAALDLSAATGTDVESASKAIGKAYAGQTGALKKLIPGLDDATLAGGDMTAIMADLESQVGGASDAAAGTAAGSMAKMKIGFDEAKESLGTALLPALTIFADKLADVAGFVQDNSKLIGIIVGVVAAFAAVIVIINAAMSIYAAVTAIAAVAQTALFWPILLIVAAIVALIAVIVLVVKKWPEITAAAARVWASVRAATAAVVSWFRNIWNAAFAWIKAALAAVGAWFRSVWSGIRAAVAAVANGVKAVWVTVFGWVRSALATVRAAFTSAFNSVRAVVASVANAVKSAWASVWSSLKSAASGAVAVLRRPFDAVVGAIHIVIDAIRDLIGWFGRIKVPKISLPKIPGFNTATATAAAPPVASNAAATTSSTSTRSSSPAPLTIVIQGAIDPESTARQIRRVLAAHDRRQGRTGAGLAAGTV